MERVEGKDGYVVGIEPATTGLKASTVVFGHDELKSSVTANT